MAFATIPEAIAEIKAGRMVIVVDDENRENEGDLTMAGQFATAAAINFMTKYGRGLICAPMAPELFEHFQIPLMVPASDNTAKFGTNFGVSVSAAEGITTGISAPDRALTMRVLADPQSKAADLAKPGHVFPLCAQAGGVADRQGHTEAAVDLARLAGLSAVGAICEILDDDGSMARLPRLERFAQEHGLLITTIEALLAYRREHAELAVG